MWSNKLKTAPISILTPFLNFLEYLLTLGIVNVIVIMVLQTKEISRCVGYPFIVICLHAMFSKVDGESNLKEPNEGGTSSRSGGVLIGGDGETGLKSGSFEDMGDI